MTVVIGVSDCRVTSETSDMLITYALGSCVGVAIYDPVARVAGLLHFMLPETPAGAVPDNPYMYADSGIPLLFREAYEKGAQKRRLRVSVAGGAQIMDDAASSISGIGTAWLCGKSSGRPGSSSTLRKPAVTSCEPCGSTWLPGASFSGRPGDARRENYKRPHGSSGEQILWPFTSWWWTIPRRSASLSFA